MTSTSQSYQPPNGDITHIHITSIADLQTQLPKYTREIKALSTDTTIDRASLIARLLNSSPYTTIFKPDSQDLTTAFDFPSHTIADHTLTIFNPVSTDSSCFPHKLPENAELIEVVPLPIAYGKAIQIFAAETNMKAAVNTVTQQHTEDSQSATQESIHATYTDRKRDFRQKLNRATTHNPSIQISHLSGTLITHDFRDSVDCPPLLNNFTLK